MPAFVSLPSSSRFAGLRRDKSAEQAAHPAPLAFPKSGAEVTAVSRNAGLARLLIVTKAREASGLRRVYRRFQVRHGSHGLTRIESVKICEIRVIESGLILPRWQIRVCPMKDRIVIDPQICSGKPVIRDTRIMVKNILGMIAGGYTVERITQAYPELTPEDVSAALGYAA
jgi:uncharacterized protein (DUF433 family)